MKWYVDTKDIHEIAEAHDQWEAFDSLRSRDVAEFGFIVTAQPVNQTEEEGSIGCRTSLLMRRWGRLIESAAFVELGIQMGLGDTTADDVAATE